MEIITEKNPSLVSPSPSSKLSLKFLELFKIVLLSSLGYEKKAIVKQIIVRVPPLSLKIIILKEKKQTMICVKALHLFVFDNWNFENSFIFAIRCFLICSRMVWLFWTLFQFFSLQSYLVFSGKIEKNELSPPPFTLFFGNRNFETCSRLL